MSNKEIPTKKIPAGDMSLAKHSRNRHRVLVDATTTKEDILRPEYFSNVANKLLITDVIEIVAKDNSWYSEYFVLDMPEKRKVWAKVAQISYTRLIKETVAEVPDGYKVNHIPALKWCVTRKADNERLISKLATKDEAHKWLSEHLAA